MRGRLSGSQPSRIVSYQRHAALKVAATGPAWRALCMGRGPAAGIWVHVLILCRPGLRSNLAHGAEPSRQIALIYEDLLSPTGDRKSTRLNSSHLVISYAVFCLKKKKHIQILNSLHKITGYCMPSTLAAFCLYSVM